MGKDAAGRVVSQRWQTSDGVQVDSTVGLTRAGTVIDETLGGVDARPGASNYVYDAAGRLTEAWVAGHHYTYDFTSTAPSACPAGTQANAGLNTNRVRLLDETSSGVSETGYCYDAADRLLSTVGATAVTNVRYDGNGNTTQYTVGGATTHLSWDGADRNIAARVTGADPADVSYIRDATDRIVRRTAAAGDTATDVRYGHTGSGDTADFALGPDNRVLIPGWRTQWAVGMRRTLRRLWVAGITLRQPRTPRTVWRGCRSPRRAPIPSQAICTPVLRRLLAAKRFEWLGSCRRVAAAKVL
ncbi:hypothetical protein ACQPW3_35650 [Actinosynnema sp. CA-248983]